MGQQLPWNYRPPQPAGAEVPKHRATKDTAWWCQGVEGRSHTLLWRQDKHQAQLWQRYPRLAETQPAESEEYCWMCKKEGFRRVSPGYFASGYEKALHGPAFGLPKGRNGTRV